MRCGNGIFRREKTRIDEEEARARARTVSIFPVRGIFLKFISLLFSAHNAQYICRQLFIDTRSLHMFPDTLYLSFIIYRRRNSAHCFPKHCN